MRLKDEFKISLLLLSVLGAVAIGVSAARGVACIIQPIRISTCFTPQQNCTQYVIDAINSARSTIKMQAYNFTDRSIAYALVGAQSRHVDVQVIVDRTQRNSVVVQYLRAHGVHVGVDQCYRIAHNKVLIIDDKRVLTGSFNYTRSAQLRNAENVVAIDDVHIAKDYSDNFRSKHICAN